MWLGSAVELNNDMFRLNEQGIAGRSRQFAALNGGFIASRF